MTDKKYRMVEVIYEDTKLTHFIIEKRVRFLFRVWWSRTYLHTIIGCYHYQDKNDCENMVHYLNKESDIVEHKCYFS